MMKGINSYHFCLDRFVEFEVIVLQNQWSNNNTCLGWIKHWKWWTEAMHIYSLFHFTCFHSSSPSSCQKCWYSPTSASETLIIDLSYGKTCKLFLLFQFLLNFRRFASRSMSSFPWNCFCCFSFFFIFVVNGKTCELFLFQFLLHFRHQSDFFSRKVSCVKEVN